MEFPKDVRVSIGYGQSEAQKGRKAGFSKPVKELGTGVLEIVEDYDTDTYRAVYTMKFGDDIFCFMRLKSSLNHYRRQSVVV